MILHAGLVTTYGAAGWRGALIEGPSGAGKSDLGLRAIALGLKLVADDRTEVWTCEGRLFGACPPSIAGWIEVRALGLGRVSARRQSQIALLVICQGQGEVIERMPEVEHRDVLGVTLPVLRLNALEASAAVKLQWALSRLGAEP